MFRPVVLRPFALLVILTMAAGCSSTGTDTTAVDGEAPGQSTTSTTLADSSTSIAVTTSTVDTGGNQPPMVTIVMPAPNEQYIAEVRGNRAVADVRLVAEVSDPEGDEIIVGWDSNLDGDLGFGLEFDATLSTGEADVGTHTITATAVDATGSLATSTVMVQVILPSS